MGMKLLLLLLVIAFAGWLITTRRRGAGTAAKKSRPGAGGQPPAAMIACTHCGVHVPQPDTVTDGQGRRYCSESHRIAGPP